MEITNGEKTDAELGDMKYPFGDCLICEDKSTGVHYGVVACEGCKGFFKRSDVSNRAKDYRCYFGGNCPITPKTRNNCKACRYQKCLTFGMAMDAVKMGRIPKAEKIRALQLVRAKQREKEKNLVKTQLAEKPDNLNNQTDDRVNGSTKMEYINGSGMDYMNGSTTSMEYMPGSDIQDSMNTTSVRSQIMDTEYHQSRDCKPHHGVVRNGSNCPGSVSSHDRDTTRARSSDRLPTTVMSENEQSRLCTPHFPPRDVVHSFSERRPIPPISEKYLNDASDTGLKNFSSNSGRLHSSVNPHSSLRNCHRVYPYPEQMKSISDKSFVLPKKRAALEEPIPPPRLSESSIFDIAGCIKSEDFTSDSCYQAQLSLSVPPVVPGYASTNDIHSNGYHTSSSVNGHQHDYINEHTTNNSNRDGHGDVCNLTDPGVGSVARTPRSLIVDRAEDNTLIEVHSQSQNCSHKSPVSAADDKYRHDNNSGPVDYSKNETEIMRPDRVFSPRVIEWLAGLVYSDPESLLRSHHLLHSRLQPMIGYNERGEQQRKRARYEECADSLGNDVSSPDSAVSQEDRQLMDQHRDMDRAVSGFSMNKFFGTERNNLEFPIRLKHSITSLFAQTNSLNIEQNRRLEEDILKGCHLDDYHQHMAVTPSVQYLSRVWDTLLPEVSYSAQVASDFCRQLPGFRCLTIEDQKTITSQAFFGLWIISNSLVYADGEFHFWLGPKRDIKYSSQLMAKFLPEHVVTELVAMSEQLMSLRPSYEELGLLSAVYVTLPIHQGLEDPLRVNALHQCYLWMLRKKLGGRSPLDRQKLLAWLNVLASHAGSLGQNVGSILVSGKPPILEESSSQTQIPLAHSHGNGGNQHVAING